MFQSSRHLTNTEMASRARATSGNAVRTAVAMAAANCKNRQLGMARRWAGSTEAPIASNNTITTTSSSGSDGAGQDRSSVRGKTRRLDQLRAQLQQDEVAVATAKSSVVSRTAATVNANRTFAIETYGCQMNVSDSEIVRYVVVSGHWTRRR